MLFFFFFDFILVSKSPRDSVWRQPVFSWPSGGLFLEQVSEPLLRLQISAGGNVLRSHCCQRERGKEEKKVSTQREKRAWEGFLRICFFQIDDILLLPDHLKGAKVEADEIWGQEGRKPPNQNWSSRRISQLKKEVAAQVVLVNDPFLWFKKGMDGCEISLGAAEQETQPVSWLPGWCLACWPQWMLPHVTDSSNTSEHPPNSSKSQATLLSAADPHLSDNVLQCTEEKKKALQFKKTVKERQNPCHFR